MNKKLIALAVAAGMAAPLAAQADVKLYGQAQVEVGSWGGDRDGQTVEDNARGRIGIKASEDLGNGLKGIAKFEFKADTADGVASGSDVALAKREMMVGLKGSWGQFEAGRLKSAYKYYGGVKYDPFVATILEARGNFGMTGNNAYYGKPGAGSAKGAGGHNGFIDDSIAYENKWGGFALRVTYDLDEGKENTTITPGATADGGNALTAAAKYGTKAWEIGAAMIDDDSGDVSSNNTEYTSTKAFGKFKFAGAHTIVVQYEDWEDKGTTLASDFVTDPLKGTIIYGGYNFKMGKNLIDVAYATGEAEPIAGGTKIDTTFARIALKHKFSKQTSTWIGYRESEADDSGTKDKESVVSLGLRKDF